MEIAKCIQGFLNGIKPFIVMEKPCVNPEKRKVLVILNPKSNRKKLINMTVSVVDALMDLGYGITFVMSSSDGRIIVDSRLYSFALIAGGDGTISDYLNTHWGPGYPPFGIIPCGTSNELGRALGITDKNYAKAILSRDLIQNDIGIINGNKRFCYVVAGGTFTDVTYNTPQDLKKSLGIVAYIFTAIANFKVQTMSLQIDIDDGRFKHNGDCLFFAVANSKSFGTVVKIEDLPKGSLNDGKLEYFIVKRPKNKLGIVGLCVSILLGRTYKNRHVSHGSGEKFKIKADEHLTLTVDGEAYPVGGEICITNDNRAYSVLMDVQTIANM